MPFLPDLTFAFRSLRKSPGFTLATVLTLALGIGAATAIFGVLDQTVLRKPHPHYERLVLFGHDNPSYGFISNSYPPQVLPCLAQGKSFEAFALVAWGRGTLETGSETFGVDFGRVNPGYFSVLGSKAGLGRLFVPDDFRPDAEAVALLNPLTWKEYFGSDPGVVGKQVVFEGRSCRIVGVLSKDFTAPPTMGLALYLPLVFPLASDPLKPFRPVFTALARLRPGISLAQANGEVAVLAAAPDAPPKFRQRFKDHPLYLKSLAEVDPRTAFGRLQGAFLAAVGFLYAIACLNAMNLMLVRLTGRRRELGIRLALGGTRGTLLRLLGLESLVLSLGSGLAGLLVAQALLPALCSLFAPADSGFVVTSQVSAGTFAFAFGFSLLTALLMALVPAWRVARLDPQEALKEGGAVLGESPRLRRLREGLIGLGVALALVLLTGTGLMTRSVSRLLKVDRGFDPAGKVAFWVDLPADLQAPEARHQLIQRLEERLRSLPGIQAASLSQTVPLAGESTMNLKKPDGSTLIVGPNPVSTDFLKSLGLKLLKGRWLPERPEGGPGVVVLNATLAQAWFGMEDPIGRTLTLEPGTSWQVIGLVADVRDQLRRQAQPQLYYPYWQDSDRSDVLTLLMDCSGKPSAALSQSVRRAIHEVEPLVGVRSAVELQERARQQMARERFILAVLQLISGLSLLLAALGLFAVMAYAVSQRRNEFGIRMALGASPGQVFRSVLRRGLALTALGAIAGLGASWALTRFIQSLLFETSPLEPAVYLATTSLLLLAATLACWIPARRAARANPAESLRNE